MPFLLTPFPSEESGVNPMEEIQCAMCGACGASHASDDELCEGCAFCNRQCEVAYIQLLAAECDRDGRNFDYDLLMEEDE